MGIFTPLAAGHGGHPAYGPLDPVLLVVSMSTGLSPVGIRRETYFFGAASPLRTKIVTNTG